MKLGSNIKKLRKEKGLSQEQLAEVMGVSTASVSKWETAQTAPELTMLMDLADYFETSVDSIMGHEVSGNRVEALVIEMENAEENGEVDHAKEVAEKLLRNYPNSAEVVEKVAECYYRIFVKTQDEKAIQNSIELTKRLFALGDTTEAKRFELLSSLGNQYAMTENWKMARKCYMEGNVGKTNNRELAYLLINEGRNDEALVAVSDVFVENLYQILMDIMKLAECYKNKEESKKAEEALCWGCEILEKLTGEAVIGLKPMKSTMCFMLALYAEEAGDFDKADVYINQVINKDVEFKGKKEYEFLSCSKPRDVIGNLPNDPVVLSQMLQSIGMDRLAEVVI